MKRILWTRPVEEDDVFLKHLPSHWIAVSCPCYQIESLPAPSIDWGIYDLIVVLSRHSTHALSQGIKTVVLSIGTGTQKTLSDQGILSDCSRHASSEGLLAHPLLLNVRSKNIAILCGKDGRIHLANTLTARGATVSVHHTYQRICDPDLIKTLQTMTLPLDGILATAVTPLQYLKQAIQENQTWLFNIPVYALSDRIKASALALGFTHIIAAKTPNAEALKDQFK
jgi:uroporphyrinogen-III synthase